MPENIDKSGSSDGVESNETQKTTKTFLEIAAESRPEGMPWVEHLRNSKRQRLLEKYPCPHPMFENIWVSLAETVEDTSATNNERLGGVDRMLQMIDKYGIKPIPDDEDVAKRDDADINYSKLPAACQDLVRELDANIGYLVYRYECGFPCTDPEMLAAVTAIAVRDKGVKSRAARHWRDVIVRELDTIRAAKDMPRIPISHNELESLLPTGQIAIQDATGDDADVSPAPDTPV